jgi:hypothetical protein
MDVPRKLGILVFSGVPAIIGGGILYHFTHSYTVVGIWACLLLCTIGAFISR